MTIWEETLLGELVGLSCVMDGKKHLVMGSVIDSAVEILRADVQSEAQYAAYSGNSCSKVRLCPIATTVQLTAAEPPLLI